MCGLNLLAALVLHILLLEAQDLPFLEVKIKLDVEKWLIR